MNAFCLITKQPNTIWCNFLQRFTSYKVFVIVDNNTMDLTSFIKNYSNIVFVQVKNNLCQDRGYINTNFIISKLNGWDKALYIFCIEYTMYDSVWFAEDDVYFYNEDTLMKIDGKYVGDDLLSNIVAENKTGEKKTWLWNKITIGHTPPYYNGMMCAVRMSRKMLSAINEYAIQHKTLYFLEALFPTIARTNHLKHSIPSELSTIHYRYTFHQQEINRTNVYHPMKNIKSHSVHRSL